MGQKLIKGPSNWNILVISNLETEGSFMLFNSKTKKLSSRNSNCGNLRLTETHTQREAGAGDGERECDSSSTFSFFLYLVMWASNSMLPLTVNPSPLLTNAHATSKLLLANFNLSMKEWRLRLNNQRTPKISQVAGCRPGPTCRLWALHSKFVHQDPQPS